MRKDTNETKEENKRGFERVGAAFSGTVFAPVWSHDETSAAKHVVEFVIAKANPGQEVTPLFEPIDLFDILEVVQTLADQFSSSPLVSQKLQVSLEKLSNDLVLLNQAQTRPTVVTRQVPNLKLATPPLL